MKSDKIILLVLLGLKDSFHYECRDNFFDECLHSFFQCIKSHHEEIPV